MKISMDYTFRNKKYKYLELKECNGGTYVFTDDGIEIGYCSNGLSLAVRLIRLRKLGR